MSKYKLTSAAFALAAALTLGAHGPLQAETGKNLVLGVDKASLYRLKEPASTIIIGNPSIADVNIQDGSLLVFTGKNYGSTNVIILDREDKEIAEFDVSVRSGGTGSLTIYKGAAKSSYNCAPTCEKSLSVGDNKEEFDLLKTQMETKMSISKGENSDSPVSPDQ